MVGPAGDFVTLVSRITGILFGVIVSLLLAVVVRFEADKHSAEPDQPYWS